MMVADCRYLFQMILIHFLAVSALKKVNDSFISQTLMQSIFWIERRVELLLRQKNGPFPQTGILFFTENV